MKSIDQLLTGYFDDINSTTISSDSLNSNDVSCNNFLGSPASFFSNPSSNIQTQIDTLNTTTTNLQTLSNAGGSGGYFCIYGEISDLKTTVNGGSFTFGGSLINPQYRLGIFTPACTLISVCLNTTTAPTGTRPIVSIIKLLGGTNIAGSGTVSTINMPVGSLLNKLTTNISFSLGDAVNIFVTTSSTNSCGNSRCTLIFQTNGVVGVQGDTGQQGDMPTLSIGTVTKLNAGSIPTCSLVENALTFGLVTGDTGSKGDRGEIGSKGDTGETGSKEDRGETGQDGAVANATGILGTILAAGGLIIG